MKITLSCDDGCADDMRIAKLCRKYDIDCVFYLPVEWRSLAYEKGYKPLSLDEAYDIASDFDIGSHTLTHRHLTKLSLEDARNEIVDSMFMLNDIFGISVTKFCYPRGYSNPEIDEIVYQYYESARLTKGVDADGYKLVHVHPNSGANNNKRWQDCMAEKTHLWLHSWELTRFGLWEELEDVLASYVTA